MLMQKWIGAGVVTVLAGYGAVALLGDADPVPSGDPSPSDGRSEDAQTPEHDAETTSIGDAGTAPIDDAGTLVEVVPCPDPNNCTVKTNGTGVYTAEGGTAGIGALQRTTRATRTTVQRQIMITHFINNNDASGSYVTFQGGYFDETSNAWVSLPGFGRVKTADYLQQTNLRVISLSEISTVPTWMISDAKTTTAVTDAKLLDLKLHVVFYAPGVGISLQATIDFNDAHAVEGKQTIHTYSMRWHDELPGQPPTAPKQYCLDASGGSDSVVFQQGIYVDPVNGHVKHTNAAKVVTMSCYRGAPATVYGWGYPYKGQSTYFDAGIQMKRASYCGDSHFYTKSGTQIYMADDQHINDDTGAIPNLEAWWAPTGALCVNSAHVRQPSMVPFKGGHIICNNQSLPSCLPPSLPGTTSKQPYLIDGPKVLQP